MISAFEHCFSFASHCARASSLYFEFFLHFFFFLLHFLFQFYFHSQFGECVQWDRCVRSNNDARDVFVMSNIAVTADKWIIFTLRTLIFVCFHFLEHISPNIYNKKHGIWTSKRISILAHHSCFTKEGLNKKKTYKRE